MVMVSRYKTITFITIVKIAAIEHMFYPMKFKGV